MSGSLARLVLRAQARLPVAEPWRPSRYAAGSPEEIGAESIAQLSDRHEPSPKATPRGPAAEPAEPRSAPIGGEREIVTEPSGPPVAKPVATTTIASALSAQTAPIGHEPPEQPPRRMPVTPELARISPKPSDDG